MPDQVRCGQTNAIFGTPDRGTLKTELSATVHQHAWFTNDGTAVPMVANKPDVVQSCVLPVPITPRRHTTQDHGDASHGHQTLILPDAGNCRPITSCTLSVPRDAVLLDFRSRTDDIVENMSANARPRQRPTHPARGALTVCVLVSTRAYRGRNGR